MPPPVREKLRLLSFLSIVLVLYNHSAFHEVDYGGRTIELKSYWAEFILFLGSDALGRVNRLIFFSISGFLFFWTLRPEFSSFCDKWKKRLKSLVVPYLLWSALGMAMYVVLHRIPETRALMGKRQVIGDASVRELVETFLLHPIPYQLWYIRDLCVYVLLSPAIYWLASRLGWWTLAGALTLWVSGYGVFGMAPSGLPFFTIGSVLAVKNIVPDFNLRRWLWPCAMVWFGLCLLHTWASVRNGDIEAMAHADRALILRMASLSGLVAAWGMVDLLGRNQRSRLRPLTGFTFFIYAAHEPFMDFVKKGLFIVIPFNGVTSVTAYLLLPVIVLIVCVKAGRLLKQYAPKTYFVLTGGRGQ